MVASHHFAPQQRSYAVVENKHDMECTTSATAPFCSLLSLPRGKHGGVGSIDPDWGKAGQGVLFVLMTLSPSVVEQTFLFLIPLPL